jgi:hypothetical protein
MNPVQQIVNDVMATFRASPEGRYLAKCLAEDRSPLDDDLDGLESLRPDVAKHTQNRAAVEKYQEMLHEAALDIATAAVNSGASMSYAEAEQQARAKIGGAPAAPRTAGPSAVERYAAKHAFAMIEIHRIATAKNMTLAPEVCRDVATRLVGSPPAVPRVEKYTASRERRDEGLLCDRAVSIATQSLERTGRVMSFSEALAQAKAAA